MLSFQLQREVQELLLAFDRAESFFEMLNAINSSFSEVDNFLIDIGAGGTTANNAANSLRNHMSQLKTTVEGINIREFYSSLEGFQISLNQAKNKGLDNLHIVTGISESIDIFAEKYEYFISAYSPQSAAPVITESKKLSSMLDGFKAALVFIGSNLEEQHFQLEDHKELSIILPSSMSMQQFALKLIAIDAMYDELCSLLNISTSEYPLVICKIESGSLLAKVLGNKKVIGLMAGFIKSSASYIFRNYTNEGKLSSIPKKIETVNAVLEFTEKLEDAGIDSTEAKEHIAKAAVAVAKELNSLLDGQAEITVNDTTHSIGEEVQKKLLEVNKPLELEHAEDEDRLKDIKK